MTKQVRIENADCGTNYTLIVKVYDQDGESWEEKLVQTIELNNPTDLTELYIHGSRKIVITEGTTPVSVTKQLTPIFPVDAVA